MPSVILVGDSAWENGVIGSGSWTTPENAVVSNAAYAVRNILPIRDDGGSDFYDVTKYLQFEGVNELPAPGGGMKPRVDGVKFYVQGYSEDGGIDAGAGYSYSIKLTASGNTIVGNDLEDALTFSPAGSNSTQVAGGETNMWGLNGDMALLVDGGVVAFTAHTKNSYMRVDNMWLEIFYTMIPDDGAPPVNIFRQKSSFMFFLEDD